MSAEPVIAPAIPEASKLAAEHPAHSLSILDSFKVVKDGEEVPQRGKEDNRSETTLTEPQQTPERPQQAPVLSPKASENFRKLEESKKAAESERDATKAELSGFKTQLADKDKRIADLEATMAQQRSASGNVDGLKLTVEEQAQQIRALQQELKAADVKRDPEFVDKYVNGRKFQEDTLADVASLVGAQKEDVHRALRMGDETKLSEIREALTPQQQRRWDVALMERERIDLERERAEKDADKTWEQLQKQRAEGFKAQQVQIASENRRMARSVMGSILEKVPDLKENRTITDQMQEIAEGLSGGKGSEHWPKDKIIESVMMGRVYETACAGMNTRIQELEGKLKTETEERKKVEGILKSRGIPYSDTAGFQAVAERPPVNGSGRLVDSIVVRK